MTNRITELFRRKNKDILSVFLTAGFPKLDSTVEVIENLSKAGVDMVEIGVPFSDPMADGPVIQESSSIALKNGILVLKIMQQIAEARVKVPRLPFVLMGYINPIIQYGIEKFFKDAMESGVDGLIIPDLPFEVYMRDFKQLSRNYNMPVIMLITPETSEERIRLIDEHCDGFIYMVSAASTTGTRESFSTQQLDYFHRIDRMNLKHPRLIGFGISNPLTLQAAFENSSGAIIGSLFIKCLKKCASINEAVALLINTLGINAKSEQ